MKEIKLWKVASNGPVIASLQSVDQTDTERLLEDWIVKSPDLLGSALKLVGRQMETASGPLDLLGVDEDGQLVVFELKRGVLTRDAVAQLLDYTSYIAELTPADLASFIGRSSGRNGIDKIDDFEDWYQEQFGRNLERPLKPKMALVGLGVDDTARRVVEFLAGKDVDISLVTFHGFTDETGTILARHVEVSQKQSAQSTRATKDYNLAQLKKRIGQSKVKDFFEAARDEVVSWLNPYTWPTQTGFTFSLLESTDAGTPSYRAYMSLTIPNPNGPAVLVLQDRTVAATAETWPELETKWASRLAKKRGYWEVRIASAAEWSEVRQDVRRICGGIVETKRKRLDAEVAASGPPSEEEGT
jgi:hypothetical protein